MVKVKEDNIEKEIKEYRKAQVTYNKELEKQNKRLMEELDKNINKISRNFDEVVDILELHRFVTILHFGSFILILVLVWGFL